MEELMRFVSIRAANSIPTQPEDLEQVRLSIATGSDYQDDLEKASDRKKTSTAKKHSRKRAFVKNPQSLKVPLASPKDIEKLKNLTNDFNLLEFAIAIVSVMKKEFKLSDELEELSKTINTVVNSNNWASERTRLFDSYLTLAYYQPDKISNADQFESAIRFIHIAESFSTTDFGGLQVQQILSGVIDPEHQFPFEEFEAIEPEPRDDGKRQKQRKLALKANLMKQAGEFVQSISKSDLKLVRTIEEETENESFSALEKKTNKKQSKIERSPANRLTTGTRSFKESVTYHLDNKALAKADKEIQPILKSYLKDDKNIPIESAAFSMLHDERMLFQSATPLSTRQINGTRIIPAIANNYVLSDFHKYSDLFFNPGHTINPDIFIPDFLPIGAGPRFSSIGVGDLLIVKQNLKQYEGLDVAHIENVLRGEMKERVHQRRRLTEETYITENETEIEEERDTQTSERYELKSEVSEELKEKLNFEAGLKVTAQLGPMVELEANAKFSYENAKTESRKKASSFSKETTERASSRHAERILERRERRLVEEVIEKNTHSINAESAASHTSGIYQWVNKIYQAQVYNYGIRQMYEFFIPEPALYYIRSLISKSMTDTEALSPPPAFNITPDSIQRSNYKMYAGMFKATDVPEPPELYVKTDLAQAGGPLDFDSTENGNVAAAFSVQIPDGYEYAGFGSSWRYTHRGDDYDFRVVVSENYGDPGTVPVYVKGRSIVSWATWVHINCRLTQTAADSWRIRVWESLKDSHEQMQRVYEDELAAATVKNGIEIAGRNPGSNKRIVKDELVRQCISAFINKSPGDNNGISGTEGVPTINWSQAFEKGSFSRFMHHAFEWENMTYSFYPYFWSRADRWLELFNIEDSDPDFQAFLQSGVVRVVVPIRPGFEGHVEYYKRNEKIWSGNQPPMVGDDDFLSIAAEIQNNTGAPGNEEPIGEPWDIRVPTQLVHLRKDDKLPKWTQDENGQWIELVEE